ncbi:MAG: phosphoesterase, partial [Myxococcota bacterium]
MEKICFYHAGCPDGFGAAWAVWQAWGDDSAYVPRGHDDPIDARRCTGAEVVFVDIAASNEILRELGTHAGRLVLLDHHVSSRDRFEADPELGEALQQVGHHIEFDLSHSGAVLAWRHFHPDQEVPELLGYVE